MRKEEEEAAEMEAEKVVRPTRARCLASGSTSALLQALLA